MYRLSLVNQPVFSVYTCTCACGRWAEEMSGKYTFCVCMCVYGKYRLVHETSTDCAHVIWNCAMDTGHSGVRL